jgi:hypothetical protein
MVEYIDPDFFRVMSIWFREGILKGIDFSALGRSSGN